MNKNIYKQYARLAVKVGTNVQKGQPLLINGPVEAYEFIAECTKLAYELGASEVWVEYNDNCISRMHYEYQDTNTLAEVPPWSIERTKWRIKKKYCTLRIISDDPDLLDGIDSNKIKKVRLANMKAHKPFAYYSMNNIGQWSIVAWPNGKWAKKIFPELDEDKAIEKLWDAILSASRVYDDDIVKIWDEHNKKIRAYSKVLNEKKFKSLHFKNNLGTDLIVGLIKNHKWEGGSDFTPDGIEFNPNIPTEEVFTMPDRYRIDGTVVSTKPLSYAGKLIEDFKLTFKDGKVVEYSARCNEDILAQLLDTDEGSKSLGEVALISHNSPISNSGILFYNTLFDENASCHLALGRCYPTNVEGGTKLTTEELYELGGNDSMVHVDFMFGSSDMEIIGIDYNDKKVKVFEKGNFIF